MVFNKKMLCVEDANSIINHFGRAFVDYYEIDTRELTSIDYWFAYDFIDIYRTTDIIQFSVNNALWTNGYYIRDCNIGSPSVSVEDDKVTITGTGLEWVVLVLELSPEYSYDDYLELEFNPMYLPVIRPFYEDIPLVMGFLDMSTGDGVSGLDVSDLITGDLLTTDSDGLVAVTSEINKRGEYDYSLECENNSTVVDYNFPYIRLKAELPVRLVNDVIYRDKRNVIGFEFLFDDIYSITEEMLFTGNDLVLVVDNTEYELNEYSDNGFNFIVPIGSRNVLNMRLKVGGNDYIGMSSVEFNVPVSVVTCSTATALKAELESELSASMVLFTGTELDTSIDITKDVLVRFTELVDSTVDNVFTVKNGAVLSLSDCNYTGKTLVTIEEGNVLLEDSVFSHCTAPVLVGSGDAIVKGCQFIDNTTCISLNGDLDLLNTLFDLSDTSYYDSATVGFVECYGDLSVDFCQFNIDVTDVGSLGLGYVFMLIGKNSLVNDVKSSSLLANEVFPVKKSTSNVNVESTNYHITSKNNKCVIYSIEDTNTVYSNNMDVEYIGECIK